MNINSIREKAAAAAGYFIYIKRGEESIVITAPDHPEWVTELAREAHGSMMPDDWRFECIKDALTAIAERDDLDLDNLAEEFSDGIDIYNADLFKWLTSRADRYAYVDEAREELGTSPDGIIAEIGWGQARERREVFDLVRITLESLSEEKAATSNRIGDQP